MHRGPCAEPGAAGLSVLYLFRPWERGLPLPFMTVPGDIPILFLQASILTSLLCISVLEGTLENEYCGLVCM